MGAVFGYGRVSTAEQSTDNQRLEIEQAGYTIKPQFWFADVVSGAMPAAQRPQFKEMLERLREGDTLVVSKLDRLGRNALDVQGTVKQLTERGVSVIVLQLGKLDLASTAGKLMLAMLSAVAEMEREVLIERTHAGLDRARAQGTALGRPAKTTARQRKSIQEQYARGTSVSALARSYGVSRGSILNIVRPKESAANVPASKLTTRHAIEAVAQAKDRTKR